jgi:hypothetical protein
MNISVSNLMFFMRLIAIMFVVWILYFWVSGSLAAGKLLDINAGTLLLVAFLMILEAVLARRSKMGNE